MLRVANHADDFRVFAVAADEQQRRGIGLQRVQGFLDRRLDRGPGCARLRERGVDLRQLAGLRGRLLGHHTPPAIVMQLADDAAGGETENRPPRQEPEKRAGLRDAGKAKQRARSDEEEVDGHRGLHEREQAGTESAVPRAERHGKRQRRGGERLRVRSRDQERRPQPEADSGHSEGVSAETTGAAVIAAVR